jgi:fatty acid-binding protein DegV
VWAAGQAIAGGADIDQAVQVVESLVPRIGAVFVAGRLNFIRTGDELEGVPVMTVHQGRVNVVSRVSSVGEAVDAMAATATGWGTRLNVAVGAGDRTGDGLAADLYDAVSRSANVSEVVRYRIGPSVGVYAGLGTVGCFMFPAA